MRQRIASIDRLKDSQIRRLARVAGVVRIDGELYGEVRGWIKHVVDTFVRDAVIYTEHMRRKTITKADMLNAWQRHYGHLVAPEVVEKKHCRLLKKKPGGIRKAKPGKRALQEVRHYQKQACLYFPRSAFADVVREVANDFEMDIRLSRDAITVAQVGVEGLVVHLLAMAQVAAIHDGKRKTLQPKDLALARLFLNESMAYCPANTLVAR